MRKRFEEQFWVQFFWGRNVNYSSNKTEFSCILQDVKRLKIFFPFCGIWLFASACATYQKVQLACLPHSSLHSFPVCWRLLLKFPFLCHFISFPSISLGMSHWQSLCNLQKYYIHRTVILTHRETAVLLKRMDGSGFSRWLSRTTIVAKIRALQLHTYLLLCQSFFLLFQNLQLLKRKLPAWHLFKTARRRAAVT